MLKKELLMRDIENTKQHFEFHVSKSNNLLP